MDTTIVILIMIFAISALLYMYLEQNETRKMFFVFFILALIAGFSIYIVLRYVLFLF